MLSQLYGSTKVVMATYALHWKWRILTSCQRQPSGPIGKIFGTIDYVIDLNNLAKFGFGKFFRDWGTYTQHIRVCAFLKTVYALRHAHSLNGWTDFHAQYLKRRRLVRGDAFSMMEKNRSLTLTFKLSKSAILFGLQNFDRHYLENGNYYYQIRLLEQTITFKLCFISQFKCNGLHDSFEILWNITIYFLLFFICDVWPLQFLINNPIFHYNQYQYRPYTHSCRHKSPRSDSSSNTREWL